jgi:hypothetical protein
MLMVRRGLPPFMAIIPTDLENFRMRRSIQAGTLKKDYRLELGI